MNDFIGRTGPWGLTDLVEVLGNERNDGAITEQAFLGGETVLVQAYGPYTFECGCHAISGGMSGELYLRACSPAHRALPPKWTI